MYRFRVPIIAVAIVTGAALAAAPGALAAAAAGAATPVNVDISQRHLNESEEASPVNRPTPTTSLHLPTWVTGRGWAVGLHVLGGELRRGKTWTTKLVALGRSDPLGDGCCDPSLSFDRYGNLF
jgi:hypothetical protein